MWPTNNITVTKMEEGIRKRHGSYRESRSGSMNDVAPKGSMLASSILLMIELPAIEAARPARKPAHTHKHTSSVSHNTELQCLTDCALVDPMWWVWCLFMCVYPGRWCVCWVQGDSPCWWWRVWWWRSYRTGCYGSLSAPLENRDS